MVDDQPAVQVVDFVLNADCLQVRKLCIDVLSVLVQVSDTYLRRPRDFLRYLGQRQAPLFPCLRLLGCRKNHRVDEHAERGVLSFAGAVHDQNSTQNSDLGCRQSNSGGVVHGIAEVAKEFLDGIVYRVYGFRNLAETNVRIDEDVPYGHGLPALLGFPPGGRRRQINYSVDARPLAVGRQNRSCRDGPRVKCTLALVVLAGDFMSGDSAPGGACRRSRNMEVEYRKRAEWTPTSVDDEVRGAVRSMISEIEDRGEVAAREFAARFDHWTGDIIVPEAALEEAAARIPVQLRDDICFARDRVRRFAEAQRAALLDTELELSPGLFAGHRNVPVGAAGCYVPGGRYAHIASAIMSVTTAKVADVPHVAASSPPKPGAGVPDTILAALELCGADTVLALGGVPAIAAMAFGLFGVPPADILVGPGNAYVAEAKRFLYGRTGIDMFAGPTEVLIIADGTADAGLVAADLVGQAEHGPDSPAWLIALSEVLAEAVESLVPERIASLPEPNRTNARTAWERCGEIAIALDRETAVALADRYAAEHLEVHAADLDWWLSRLRNYGSLFLGQETTVTYGDKVAGPNHILPTRGAARYSGGLWVGKFLKTVTWQRMTREANRDIGPAAARISRLEGMEGHARTVDERLERWFPEEEFALGRPA